jgi:hypothetical protein
MHSDYACGQRPKTSPDQRCTTAAAQPRSGTWPCPCRDGISRSAVLRRGRRKVPLVPGDCAFHSLAEGICHRCHLLAACTASGAPCAPHTCIPTLIHWRHGPPSTARSTEGRPSPACWARCGRSARMTPAGGCRPATRSATTSCIKRRAVASAWLSGGNTPAARGGVALHGRPSRGSTGKTPDRGLLQRHAKEAYRCVMTR